VPLSAVKLLIDVQKVDGPYNGGPLYGWQRIYQTVLRVLRIMPHCSASPSFKLKVQMIVREPEILAPEQIILSKSNT